MLHALVSVELRLRATFTRISELSKRTVPSGNFRDDVLWDHRRGRATDGLCERKGSPRSSSANGEFEPLAVTGPAARFPRVAPMREGMPRLLLVTDSSYSPTASQMSALSGRVLRRRRDRGDGWSSLGRRRESDLQWPYSMSRAARRPMCCGRRNCRHREIRLTFRSSEGEEGRLVPCLLSQPACSFRHGSSRSRLRRQSRLTSAFGEPARLVLRIHESIAACARRDTTRVDWRGHA